jgi:PIN domain nuclease of toxin-antitoxin system
VRLLLDTHVWLWTLTDPDRLGRRARSAVARATSELWLSPISVWELLVLAERGRVKLDEEPGRWAREALERSPVREAALTHEVAVRSREIAPSHPDPADRFIMATALAFELTLLTADEALLDLRLCPLLPAR